MENTSAQYFYEQWQMLVRDWVNGMLNALTDEQLKTEVSPGKNHGIFLLGHLVVSDDDFAGYMGKGDMLYPHYVEMFAYGAKLKHVEEYPPASELREAWDKVCEKNEIIYKELTDAELEEEHALIKDPQKDYFKTKARIIMAWQLHQAYHAGQLAVIHSKTKEAGPPENQEGSVNEA